MNKLFNLLIKGESKDPINLLKNISNKNPIYLMGAIIFCLENNFKRMLPLAVAALFCSKKYINKFTLKLVLNAFNNDEKYDIIYYIKSNIFKQNSKRIEYVLMHN